MEIIRREKSKTRDYKRSYSSINSPTMIIILFINYYYSDDCYFIDLAPLYLRK